MAEICDRKNGQRVTVAQIKAAQPSHQRQRCAFCKLLNDSSSGPPIGFHGIRDKAFLSHGIRDSLKNSYGIRD